MRKLSVLTNGILKENPVLVLLLGTCATLAVTTLAKNAIGMGAATTFVLTGSNIVIALLKKVIPDKVRIPCYVVVIAGFVTIVQLLIQAYAPAIDKALGIFLPLIVVNCIILGRAEMFANKNSVIDSALDGIGMGIGFTLTLLAMGTIREIFGSGSWMGIHIMGSMTPIAIVKQAPGGFFLFGSLIAMVNKYNKAKGRAVRNEIGCEGCPAAGACPNAAKGEC